MIEIKEIIKGTSSITGRKDPKRSRHIVVPAAVLREFDMCTGDKFSYEVKNGKWILTPLKE